jgi:hypothetical protein
MSSLETVLRELNELQNSGEAGEMLTLMSRVQMGMEDAKVSISILNMNRVWDLNLSTPNSGTLS